MQNPRSLILMLSTAALMACNASAPAPETQPQPAPASPTAATAAGEPVATGAQPTRRFAEELRYATYPIDTTADGKAPLEDGVYEASVAGSSGANVVRLGPAPAFGDLDGDGVEDAAVILLANPGGSGSFSYVSAVLNDNGAARPVGSMLVGDRITVQSMRIVDGNIDVTWLDRKPGEPMSTAPTIAVSKRFVVQGGKLVAVATPATESSVGVQQLRGHYTWGAEVETFQPCGSQQSFWIVGDKALLQTLRDKAAQLAQARGKPYQPVYIEASAVSEGKATDGFAMDHDAVYRLETLQAVSDTSPAGCTPSN